MTLHDTVNLARVEDNATLHTPHYAAFDGPVTQIDATWLASGQIPYIEESRMT